MSPGRYSLFLILIFLFAGTVFSRNNVQLFRNQSIPLHYNVQLSIDVQSRKFSVEESIVIIVVQDTNEIQINSNRLSGAWMKSRLVVGGENGRVFVPFEAVTEYDEYSEVLSLRFDEMIPAGIDYTLHLTEIEGSFGIGIIEVQVPEETGREGSEDEKHMITTGFDVTNLRAVFPCYDQPEFRTTFDFVIYHNEGFTLLTNSDYEITKEGERIRNEFKIKTPISTSSIGFLLTKLDPQTSTDNRVRVFHENKELGAVLLNNYHKLFLAIEEELGMPLECPKLDIVHISTLPMKTLTKWGLIAISAEMSPVEHSPIHSTELKQIQMEIARSVYQMFFGQMIGPQWWTSQWVTLGLSRYFSGVSKHLPFDTRKEFVSNTIMYVLREHSAPVVTEWYLEREYYTSSDINNPKMFVVDLKASALMWTIAHLMGEQNFKKALLDLLHKNRFSTITTSDFALQLDKYSTVIPRPPDNSWPAFIAHYRTPLPSSVAETIFVAIKKPKTVEIDRVWSEGVDLPIFFNTRKDWARNFPSYWLPAKTNEIVLNHIDAPWIQINPNLIGLYRVRYSDELWRDLAKQFEANNTRLNRGQLISDSGSLSRMLTLHIRYHLMLVQLLPKDTETLVWRETQISFVKLAFLMRNYPKRELFRDFYINLVSEIYLENRIGINFKDFERTMEVATIACHSNYTECVMDVEDYYKMAMKSEGLTGSKDFQWLIYSTLVMFGKDQEKLADDVFELWKKDRGIYSTSRVAIKGLAMSTNPNVIMKFLKVVGSDLLEIEFGIILKPMERFFILNSCLRGSCVAMEQTLEYLLKNFEEVAKRLDDMIELFRNLHKIVCSDKAKNLIRELQFVEHELMMTEHFKQILESESNLSSVTLLETDYRYDQFEVFLKENAKINWGGPSEGNLLWLIAVFVVTGIVLGGIIAYVKMKRGIRA